MVILTTCVISARLAGHYYRLSVLDSAINVVYCMSSVKIHIEIEKGWCTYVLPMCRKQGLTFQSKALHSSLYYAQFFI